MHDSCRADGGSRDDGGRERGFLARADATYSVPGAAIGSFGGD